MNQDAPEAPGPAPSPGYSRYVLFVLVLVYVLNFLDRQIITILAEDIKRDLGISDAQIGFLYGTAFAVFYAVFGIPLGRLADVWSRRSLIALGLGFWSLMTAVSGLAKNFAQLGAARVGVGVGEASATPAAFSMLSDSFPARARATVIAIYSSGIYIGAGLGLLIGGQVVARWNDAFPTAAEAPLGLAGWQAAYLAVGLPGLLLAVWVRTLREPVRGAIDGIVSEPEPHPFRAFFYELRSVLPPFTVVHLAREGAGGRGVAINLGIAAAIAALAAWLVHLTGNLAQWLALGVGLYAAASWMQALGLRDRPTSTLIFGTPSLRYASLGFSFLAFAGYGIGGWTPIFFMRIHDQPSDVVGNVVGITAAAAGFIGVMLGGALADWLRSRSPVGRLYVGLLTALVPVPFVLWMLGTDNVVLAYSLNFFVSVFAAMWLGAGGSTVQDLVLPRMRAVASAFYLLIITFIGLALGPYTVGRLSDVLGDLPMAMRLALLSGVLACLFLALAMRHLERDEQTLLDRARAAGEDLSA
ncbi:MAG: spinster family MFS transporter [Myxococcota bacterium]